MLTHKRENPMATRSKNALASSLLELMLRRSFGEISISDITEYAGLSRQTFYTNFQKKEDILIYLIRRLFQKYYNRLSAVRPVPENLIIDYFIFWGDSRDFLSLLFKQELGYIFQNCNRAFFVEDTDILDSMFTAQDWQLPYIKASLAGVTYELLFMWITKDQGLSVDVLNSMTLNLLGGKIFA